MGEAYIKMARPSWLVKHYHEPEQQYLWGVNVGDITSVNDGDVSNAAIVEKLLERYTEPICVDIGGDVGWWSSFCLEHSKTAKVFTFEPNPMSFEALQKKFEGESRIQLVNRAVSDIDGELLFSFDGPQSNSRGGGTQRIQTTTLDWIPAIHILKIDTEGHEPSILRGLQKRFSTIDSILFEFTPYWYGSTETECIENSAEVLYTILKEYPYVYSLSRRGLPVLHQLEDEDAILHHIVLSMKTHAQHDIFCTRAPMEIDYFD